MTLTTSTCPLCLGEGNLKGTRCPQCMGAGSFGAFACNIEQAEEEMQAEMDECICDQPGVAPWVRCPEHDSPID